MGKWKRKRQKLELPPALLALNADYEFDRITVFQEWNMQADMIFAKSRILKTEIGDEWSTDPPIDTNKFDLPPVKEFFSGGNWSVDNLISLKQSLNRVKSCLDHKDLKPWHNHTRAMNPGNLIQDRVKYSFDPEYCSQAWGKLFEIISTQDIIPGEILSRYAQHPIEVEVNSVHLCEAPGAFISAANHHIRTHFPKLKWNWLATTLNPYHEGNETKTMINEDKLIQINPENWTFLNDQTGNIISHENIRGLKKTCISKFSSIHFITADGSVDCQDEPCDQENIVVQLQYAEIITALLLLSEGGSFVIKIFTFFEAATISHLYLLSCVFKEVKLLKPAMSREGNSEVYVVCMGYIGVSSIESELAILLSNVGKSETGNRIPIFQKSHIDKEFLLRLEMASEFFANTQMKIITRNLVTDRDREFFRRHIRIKQCEIADHWVENCKLRKLDKEFQLNKNGNLNCESLAHVDPRVNEECLILRLSKADLNLSNLKTIMSDKLKFYKSKHPCDRFSLKIKLQTQLVQKLQLGRAYKYICGSRFCYGKLVNLRKKMIEVITPAWTSAVNLNELDALAHKCSVEVNKEKLQIMVTKLQGDEPWTLKSICYHEAMNDLATTTDVDRTMSGLVKLVETVEKLETGGSLFLCDYPLLTRMHVGFIFCLTALFERTSLVYHKERDILGVLLYKYGVTDETKQFLDTLSYIALSFGLCNPERIILECVDMQLLLKEIGDSQIKYLLKYNVINTVRSMESNLNFADKLKLRNHDLQA